MPWSSHSRIPYLMVSHDGLTVHCVFLAINLLDARHRAAKIARQRCILGYRLATICREDWE